ncbi:MAG: hypothetical protein DRN95_04405 [Candidatus Hydrothermarchaeota archaeon]|nr:MAG: hypothetical protein DRN95_04405 [Candidatus Hydrothermarchaeota archaeon]
MRLTNAIILHGEEFEVIKGHIIIENGEIKEVGEGSIRNAIDLEQGIIFPAFTNAHVHLGDSIAQDYGHNLPIEARVGRKGLKFKILRNREITTGIKESLKEMFKIGITTFCDFRELGLKGIKQIKEAGLKIHDSIILGRPNGEVDKLEKLLEECDGIGISSVNDYSEEDLRKIAEEVRKRNKLLAFHCSEVKDDVAEVLKYNPSFVVHLTNAREESLEEIFKRKIPVVLCPRANATLGVGIPRLREIFENTLVALGTDNVMINSFNMFREMEFTFKLIRGLYKDHEFDAKEVLKAATLNGRKILGLEPNTIEEGKKANMIILKGRKYLYDPVVAIIHRFEVSDIRGVIKEEKMFWRD